MNVAVGDVIVPSDGFSVRKPYGRVLLAGRWYPITLEPDGVFLVLKIETLDEGEVEVDVLALSSGDKLHVVLDSSVLGTELSVMRGERVILGVGCGSVRA